MGRKKGRRTRSDDAGRRVGVARGDVALGEDQFQHHRWTHEGQIERAGAFARALRYSSWRPRGVRTFIAAAVIAPFAIVVLVAMVQALLD